MEDGKILSHAKGVARVGNTVTRPAQRWSPSIRAFLAHLEAAGLPVEHMIVIAGGQETYGFVEAEMVHPGPWTNEALFAVGQLVARLHRAGQSFVPPEDLGCKTWYLREIGDGARIWCHGDIAPWNMLTMDGMPHVLVDWEFAGPLDPMVELARVCWLFVQLHDDDLQAMHGLPSPEIRARQVRILCDGYGLDAARRANMVERIIEAIICETAHEAIDAGVTFNDEGNLWGLAWRARALYWVWRHRAILEKALK